MDAYWQAPPITRTLTAATLALSVLVYTYTLNGAHVVFSLPRILKWYPELWRLVTSFLITGPKLNIIFDSYFLFIYGKALEVDSPRFSQPGDFFTFIVFSWFMILIAHVTLVRGYIFLQALILALVYIYAQDNRGQKAFLLIISIPVEFLPYTMLLLTWILSGSSAAISQATGLIAAHLFDFLTRIYPTFGGGTNRITTPRFVRLWFSGGREGPVTRGYGTSFTPRQQTPAGTSSGFSSGLGSVSNLWNSRGAGRRLGE